MTPHGKGVFRPRNIRCHADVGGIWPAAVQPCRRVVTFGRFSCRRTLRDGMEVSWRTSRPTVNGWGTDKRTRLALSDYHDYKLLSVYPLVSVDSGLRGGVVINGAVCAGCPYVVCAENGKMGKESARPRSDKTPTLAVPLVQASAVYFMFKISGCSSTNSPCEGRRNCLYIQVGMVGEKGMVYPSNAIPVHHPCGALARWAKAF